jgi:hypothetical protein
MESTSKMAPKTIDHSRFDGKIWQVGFISSFEENL